MDAIFAVTARDLTPRRQRPAAPRRGFTLVEMLTVIVIIGILASLVTGAVMAAKRKARITVITLEISQFDRALKGYKTKYGEYPPDFSAINTPQGKAAVVRHLSKAFPRIDLGAGNTSAKFGVFASRVSAACGLDVSKLDASSALVFWLGGLPDGAGSKKLMGFSANARNPFDATSASRTQPLFEFDPQRLRINDDGVIQYFPKTGGSGENAPYVYFRPRNGNYTGKSWNTATPFEDTRTNEWMKPREFQILSAGLDGLYGTASKFPTGDDYDNEGFDNITNFSEGTLEDKM